MSATCQSLNMRVDRRKAGSQKLSSKAISRADERRRYSQFIPHHHDVLTRQSVRDREANFVPPMAAESTAERSRALVAEGKPYDAMELAKSKVNRLRRRNDARSAAELATACARSLSAHPELANAVQEPAFACCETQCSDDGAAVLGERAPSAALTRWSKRNANDSNSSLLLAATIAHANSVQRAETDLVYSRAVLLCLLRQNIPAIQMLCEHIPPTPATHGSVMFAQAISNRWFASAKMVAQSYKRSFQRDPQLLELVHAVFKRANVEASLASGNGST